MERRQVQSSNVKSVGYDASTGTLEIEFHSGGTYLYYDVPEETYAKLMDSPSIGRAVKELIVGHFRHEPIQK